MEVKDSRKNSGNLPSEETKLQYFEEKVIKIYFCYFVKESEK